MLLPATLHHAVPPAAAALHCAQVTEQAASGELGPGAVLEGGDTDTERRCAFLEAALALAGGLDDKGLATLLKAAKPGLQARGAVGGQGGRGHVGGAGD